MDSIEKVATSLGRLYVPFTFVGAWGRRTTTYQVDGSTAFTVRVNSFDKLCIDDTWKGHLYGSVPEGAVVLDVGAHIGGFAVYASRSASRVVSLEPHPGNRDLLLENLERNGVENVDVVPKALSHREGRAPLFLSRRNTGSHSLCEADSRESIDVDTTTLRALLAEESIDRVDLLRMDIVGAEYEVLAALEPEVAARIDRIVVAYHDYLDVPGDLGALLRTLERLGFHTEGTNFGLFNRIFKQGCVTAVRGTPSHLA